MGITEIARDFRHRARLLVQLEMLEHLDGAHGRLHQRDLTLGCHAPAAFIYVKLAPTISKRWRLAEAHVSVNQVKTVQSAE